ncbi:MAG: DUF4153 domain-containing protein [Chitinophagaceae bacterium]|nr:DUF4153 domain-containing protein [Chitinophagaceae bacterium]
MWSILKKLTGSTQDAIQRFPIPILSALLAYIFILLEIHGGRGHLVRSEFICAKLFYECVCGISLFAAFTIFSERNKLSKSTQLGLLLLGFSVLGLHYFSISPRLFHSSGIFPFVTGTLFLSRFVFFFICFHLLVSLAAFQKITEIKSFWQFNQYLFSNLITSLLFSVALFIGLGSALLAIDKLFGFHLSFNWYLDLVLFIFLVFNTIFFFINFPTDFTGFKEATDYKKWLRIFLQYVLIPIVVVYLVILYAYIFKILMYHHYPKGWVCIPILIFSILGTLSYLLAYPIRLNKENRIVYVFTQYFFYTLLPLLSLYFISILSRITSYGITEDRYLVLILGIWLLVISIYIITSRIDNIIFVPTSLLTILFLAAIGPWGMFQMSIRNQVNRLERNLKRNGLLVEGKLVTSKEVSIPDEDVASIQSILDFLNRRGAITALNPWLEEKAMQQLKTAAENDDEETMQIIFSIPKVKPVSTEHDLYILQEEGKDTSSGYLHIAGYNRLKSFDTGIDMESDSVHFGLFLRDNLYLVSDSGKIKSCLPDSVLTHYRNLLERKNAEAVSSGMALIDISQKTYFMPSDSLIYFTDSVKIQFQKISFYKQDSLFKLYHVRGYLLTK